MSPEWTNMHRLPSYQVLSVDYTEALLFVDFFLV